MMPEAGCKTPKTHRRSTEGTAKRVAVKTAGPGCVFRGAGNAVGEEEKKWVVWQWKVMRRWIQPVKRK